MEGIRDGEAVDNCFLCALIFPDLYADDCPRCRRRMRYSPAEHLDGPATDAVVGNAIEAYRDALTSRDRLIELLALLHRLQPQSLEVLERSPLTLDELRFAYKLVS